MTDAPRYRARDRNITHERLDDEVIAIDLDNGAYFAMTGSAADVWSSIMSGADRDGVVATLATRYGADAAAVRDDVDAFLARLLDEGLVVTDGSPGRDRVDTRALPPVALPTAWAAPELERYDDMADLVLLDPIHDADESGWPHVAPGP